MRKLEKRLETSEKVLGQLVDDLINGKLELDSWIVSTADNLREMTILRAKIAKGGLDLDKQDKTLIRNHLRDAFLNGEVIQRDIDETGKITKTKHEFGLKKLITEIESGDISEDGLKTRIDMYANHTRVVESSIESRKRQDMGYNEALNILGKTKSGSHHPICQEATARGWMEINELEKTFGFPSRHPRCSCSLVYR